MNSLVLQLDNINKSFGGLSALSDINLHVEEGTTHAIIGPNGAGKSTLLNVCIGRLKPDTGKVTFAGEVLTGRQPHEIAQLGVARVFQTPEIFQEMTLLENVMIPAFSHRDGAFRLNAGELLSRQGELRDDAEHILEDVGLKEMMMTEAGSLSRGDKRRLELGMCLILRPRLLLLDEPTAGMARHDTNQTIELLKKIKSRGMTKVIIEHDMHVVFSLADKVSVLARGQIIAGGDPQSVREDPKVKEAYLGGAH
ncbi:ABC transporter ATP-binding protein [Sneathiella litorea]|uniref:ATP-binding cassette domain-containing protein n=1 Tax=Sneathiella litorea TaxID=2606216 RepID=A0A6L8W9G0_9PROT|nr:ABC transporter ATP-binding protein [Sneathiella litorea]MZR31349.1 ATP-binding cassette domain-containing protein [Sneathiella litorea]